MQVVAFNGPLGVWPPLPLQHVDHGQRAFDVALRNAEVQQLLCRQVVFGLVVEQPSQGPVRGLHIAEFKRDVGEFLVVPGVGGIQGQRLVDGGAGRIPLFALPLEPGELVVHDICSRVGIQTGEQGLLGTVLIAFDLGELGVVIGGVKGGIDAAPSAVVGRARLAQKGTTAEGKGTAQQEESAVWIHWISQ